MKRSSLAIICFLLLLSFAACRPSKQQEANASPSPTVAAPTEASTEAPSEEPSEEPFPYDRGEYEHLLAFFETADDAGVKNGDKLFNRYDPQDPASWQHFPEPDYFYEVVRGAEWEDGHLVRLRLPDVLEGGERLEGTLELIDFSELTSYYDEGMRTGRLDGIIVNNCPKLGTIMEGTVRGTAEIEEITVSDSLSVSSLSEVICSFRTEPGDELVRVHLRTDSDFGMVGVSVFNEPYIDSIGQIFASANRGYQFDGWYSPDSKLISEEQFVPIDRLERPSDRLELTAVFGDQKPLFPTFEGELPSASPVIASLKDGERYECDLDFDGLTDTVHIMTESGDDGAMTFTLTITRGAAPDDPFVFTAQGWTKNAGVRIIDTDISDSRLEVLMSAGAETEGDLCLVRAFRVNAEGTGIDPIGNAVGLLRTDKEGLFEEGGSFDAENGIPIMILSDVLGTHLVCGRMTISGRQFMLIEPFGYVYRESVAVIGDIEGEKLENGEPSGSITLRKGDTVELVATDNWSFVDVKTADGEICRIGISMFGTDVLINGADQSEYFEVPYGE